MEFSEGMRQGLSLAMVIVNVFLAVVGVGVIAVAFYVKESAAQYRIFITSKDDNTFHTMLLATGALLIVIHGIGAKLFVVCRQVNSRQNVTFPLAIFRFLGGSIKVLHARFKGVCACACNLHMRACI